MAWKMREAVVWFQEWTLLASRAGTQLALTTALSWHPQIDLNLLVNQREEFELQPEDQAVIFERSQHLAQYADVDLFVEPLPAAPEEEEEDLIDGLYRCSRETPGGITAFVEPSLDNVSAASLSMREMWWNSQPPKKPQS